MCYKIRWEMVGNWIVVVENLLLIECKVEVVVVYEKEKVGYINVIREMWIDMRDGYSLVVGVDSCYSVDLERIYKEFFWDV